MTSAKPRLGLIGTGIWARDTHAAAAATSDSVRFTAVLGRDQAATLALAEPYGVAAHADLATFLEEVDIVGIALPPAVQPEFAMAAIAAGKHLLLEKPIAIDSGAADRIAEACDERGLASLVFFTQLLIPRVRTWIDDALEIGGWIGGRIDSFSSVLVDPANPYHRTAWRRQAGALWDVGPHAVALLVSILGQVKEVSATAGPGDLRVLTLTHEGGAVATVSLAMDVPAPSPGETAIFGRAGKLVLPPSADWGAESRDAYRNALASLASAAQGQAGSHPDAHFAAHITAVLVAAQLSIATGQQIAPS
jgi:predicted dehydrogenase